MKSSFIRNICLVALILYLLYLFISLQIKINEKKDQLKDQQTQISSLKAENERLNDILNAIVDDDYVEKIAREKGYIKSDEKVYQSVTD